MKVQPLQIHWHDKQPIYSLDFDPSDPSRLATAGGDNNVRLWRVVPMAGVGTREAARVDYLATLARHVRSVNCVRFSPSGKILASGGDGGNVILWKQSPIPILSRAIVDDDAEEAGKEYWTVLSMLRFARLALHLTIDRTTDGEDIYDLAWSPCGKYIAVALTDNTAQVWDVKEARLVRSLRDHQHFVQGVSWDPLNHFVATQSSDRSVKIWRANSKGGANGLSFTPINKLNKLGTGEEGGEARTSWLFHDETLVSFFRRLAWTPDGAFVILPAGMSSVENGSLEAFYLLPRNGLNGLPCSIVSGFNRAVLAARCNPRLFKKQSIGNAQSMTSLPYRSVFAVATQDTVLVYDTQQLAPICSFSNLHYSSLTDLAWNSDGSMLAISSVDGFVSCAVFERGELGEALLPEEQAEAMHALRQRFALTSAGSQSAATAKDGLLAGMATSEADSMPGPAETMPSDTLTMLPSAASAETPPRKKRIQPTLVSTAF